jgi:hypothetical protein
MADHCQSVAGNEVLFEFLPAHSRFVYIEA